MYIYLYISMDNSVIFISNIGVINLNASNVILNIFSYLGSQCCQMTTNSNFLYNCRKLEFFG